MVRNSEITLEQIFKEGRINLDNDDFNCLICSFPLFDGLQCKRGHGACKSCWIKIVGENGKKECHSCRIPIKSLDDLSKNLYLEKEIFKQKVICLNNGREKFGNTMVIKSDGGCKRQDITIEGLLHHIRNECGYLLIDCKYSKDCKYYKQTSLEQHQNECQFMSIHCPGLCGKKDTRLSINKHLETPSSCKPLISSNLENKNNNNNNSEFIKELYKYTNEMTKINQNQLKVIKDNESEIRTLKSRLDKSSSMIGELEDELGQLKERFSTFESLIDRLDGSVTNRSGSIIIHGWKKKLKSLDVGDIIVEENFCIGSNMYYLRVYPYGTSFTNSHSVSVVLGRVDDDEKRMDIDLKVQIKDYDVKKKISLSYLPGDYCRGIGQLIPTHQTEKDSKFILYFKVDLKPKI
ncbi:hypothetical protein RB653_004039 [Dictyostelium firmibasis]|uniref:Uncharacterized protein n=1 Tax=Dictyostelium firmibasis TaxID=79012 RepID=A0AAN7YS20_9MYCE